MSLRNYKSKEYLFREGELFLINPKGEKRIEFINVIKENQQLQLKGEKVDIIVIRYILENLTNFADEVKIMSDEEIIDILDDGVPSLNRLTDKIEELLRDCGEEILRETNRELNTLIDVLNILSYSEQENKVFDKLIKLFKKNKINITKEEFIELKDKPDELMILLNKKKKGNK